MFSESVLSLDASIY
jgi:flagellar biosynthesis chaperone FliJ